MRHVLAIFFAFAISSTLTDSTRAAVDDEALLKHLSDYVYAYYDWVSIQRTAPRDQQRVEAAAKKRDELGAKLAKILPIDNSEGFVASLIDLKTKTFVESWRRLPAFFDKPEHWYGNAKVGFCYDGDGKGMPVAYPVLGRIVERKDEKVKFFEESITLDVIRLDQRRIKSINELVPPVWYDMVEDFDENTAVLFLDHVAKAVGFFKKPEPLPPVPEIQADLRKGANKTEPRAVQYFVYPKVLYMQACLEFKDAEEYGANFRRTALVGIAMRKKTETEPLLKKYFSVIAPKSDLAKESAVLFPRTRFACMGNTLHPRVGLAELFLRTMPTKRRMLHESHLASRRWMSELSYVLRDYAKEFAHYTPVEGGEELDLLLQLLSFDDKELARLGEIAYRRHTVLLLLEAYELMLKGGQPAREDMLAVAERVLELAPKYGQALLLAGDIYCRLGQRGEALRVFEKVMETPESTAWYPSCMQAARIRVELYDYRAAKDIVLRAIRKFPEKAYAYGLLGQACANLGQLEDAEKAYETFFELAPKHPDAESFRNALTRVKQAKALTREHR